MTRTRPRGLLTLLVMSMASCTDLPTDTVAPETLVATALTVSPATSGFSSLGETQQLTATVTDQNGATMSGASVSWASSASTVASASSAGLITAVATGTATITATSGSTSGTVSITVQQVATSSTLSPSSLVLAGPADTETLIALVMDAGGTEIADPDLTWSSDDEGIATVSSTGLVTAVASGSATITVEAASGGQTVTQALSIAVEDAVLADPSGGEVSLAADAVSVVLPAGAVSEAVFLTAEPATRLPAEPEPRVERRHHRHADGGRYVGIHGRGLGRHADR